MVGRFIAHMGLPKTGTTAIQEWLVGRADDLAAFGILVPSGVIAANGNARDLANALHHAPADRSPAQQSLVDGLQAALATGQDVVISAEYLEKVIFRPALVARTAASLRDIGARWDIGVMFLRNTFDLLNSSYAQNVKVGPYPHDFAEFLAMRRRNRLNEYDRNAAHLRADGVEVRMAAYRSGDGAMTEALLALAGLRDRLPHDFDFSTPRSNESIGTLGLLVARRVWRLMQDDLLTPPPRMVADLGQIILGACSALEDRPFNGFTPALRAVTATHYAPVMANIRADLSPEDYDLLHRSRTVDLPVSPMRIADLDPSDRRQIRVALDRIAASAAADPYLSRTLPRSFASQLAGPKQRQ
jgi:hypothetical protein